MIQKKTLLLDKNGVGFKLSAVQLPPEALMLDALFGIDSLNEMYSNEGSGDYEVMVFAHANGVTDYDGIAKHQFETEAEVIGKYNELIEQYRNLGYEAAH